MPPAPSERPSLAGGRYLVERKLGEGGHAAVYRVLDARLGVRRAVKIMLPDAARRPKLRARFEREASTMAALDHPNVVRVYDVVPDAPLPYMVMELLTGGSLGRWLEVHGPMPPRLAVECVRQAGQGLLAAHARGVVHRDVKPHNVLVSSAGVCKVTDFGIARVGDLGHTRAGAAMGTQGYMAPEQARDASSVDVRVDVFSLGMTLFVLATGRDPLERVAGRGLDELPEALRPIVERATAFDRNRRPPDVTHLLAELEDAARALPAGPPGPPLALPESEGEDLDPEELSTLADERRTTDERKTTDTGSLPPQRVLPYTVPARVASDQAPDWLAPEGAPPPPTGFEVRAEGRPREEAPEAEAQSGAEPEKVGGLDPAEEARGVVRQLVDIALRNLLDPSRALPTFALLLVFFVGVPLLETRDLRARASEARAAHEALEEAARDPRPLELATALGGDGETLRKLHAAWAATPDEPARSAALKRYLDAVDNDLRQYGIQGMPETDETRRAVVALRLALSTYETRRDAWEASRASVPGCLEIGITPP